MWTLLNLNGDGLCIYVYIMVMPNERQVGRLHKVKKQEGMEKNDSQLDLSKQPLDL